MKHPVAALVGGAVGSAAAACTPTTPPTVATPMPAQDASADEADVLDALFRDGSPEDIAAELEAMVGVVEAGPEAASDAKAAPRPRPPPPPLPHELMKPVYKGVSF